MGADRLQVMFRVFREVQKQNGKFHQGTENDYRW